jgi:uncharacterized protein involved in exopolysaccharide biosynthesis
MLEVVGDSPSAGSSHAFLLVISGSEPGRLHVLEKPELVIGRSKYADIRISERAMSQQHAKIVQAGDGHRIYDLGSTNGTFVNDQQIESVDLRAGDVVRTGETVFTYMASGSTAAAAGGGTDSTMTLPPTGRVRAPEATPIVSQPPPGIGPGTPPPPSAPSGGGALVLRSQVAPAAVGMMPQVIGVPAAAPVEEESDPIGLIIKVLDFIKRYWLQMGIFTVLGVGLGVASYKFSKPPAVAKFEVQLIQPPTDNIMTKGRRMNFEFFRSAQKSFRRPAIIRASLEALGEENLNQKRLRKIHDSLVFKQANRREAKDVYEGSYQAKTADAALEYLRVHLKIFIDTEIDKAMKVLLVEVETLEKKLKQADENLNATEQAVMAFRQEHSEGLPEQAQALYQEMIALRSAKGQTAGAVTEASETLKVRRKGLSSEAPELQRRIDLAQPYEDSIAEVSQALVEARAANKGPQHPDVIKLKRQKAQLEKKRDDVLKNGGSKIVKERNPLYEDRRIAKAEAEAQLRIAQSQLSRLTNDMEKTKKLVDALPRLQREYAELTRSYESTKASRKRIFDSLESSRIQLDLERASAAARYDITTPPNVEPVSKVKTIVMRAGVLGFLGFGFGIFLGLVRDLRRILATRLAQRAGRA